MNEILFKEIPSLDLSDFTSGQPEKKAKFVNDLGEAFNHIGFVAIKNHGLTEQLTEQLSDGSLPFEKVQKISEQILQINNSIDEKEMRWLELSESMT